MIAGGAFGGYVPEGWLPHTTIQFVGVNNPGVAAHDTQIDERLRAAYSLYAELGGNPGSWKAIKLDANGGSSASSAARQILSLQFERLLLFEGHHDAAGKLASARRAMDGKTGIVLCRYVEAARSVADFLLQTRDRVLEADGTMTRSELERRTQALRAGDTDVLVMTRELGGRGLDFPDVDTATVLSPRSQYQAVAQEIARIRSRKQDPKLAVVLYYEGTTETRKARRLADHLAHDNLYRGERLFEITDVPSRDSIPPRDLSHLANAEVLTARPSLG